MQKTYICFIFFFLFFKAQLFSQTLTGTVLDSENEQVFSATVLIRDSTTPDEVKEYTIARNGSFSITLKKAYTNIVIEVASNEYHSVFDTIKKPQKDKTYHIDFLLLKKDITRLDEVVVVAKESPFVVKKDTLVYRVSRYMDGTERKIEEVIKKLPGIQVNESTGEIKYQGKSIETVLLEGDNLFGYNYSIGTKNINVDMVEEIEAIENYSENLLLKGVEGGEKVALNLKLKKGKTDLSGSVDVGSGLFEEKSEALSLGSTLLGISKNYKSFATLSYNNIGVNHSPFNYFSFNLSAEQLREREYLAEKIIPESQFSNSLDDKRVNINNQFFGNYNSIFKISEKLTLKTNLYYIQDKIESNPFFENQYTIDENQSFTITDYTLFTKKPKQYRGDLKVTYHSSAKSLLEYDVKIRQENINTITTITSNNTSTLNSSLQSEDFYLNQKLLFTQKLTDHKVFQSTLLHTLNDIPQILKITPATEVTVNPLYGSQKSHHKKNYVGFENTFMGNNKGNKYSFSLGASLDNNPFYSKFSPLEELDTIHRNHLTYNINKVYQLGGYDWNLKKWKISPSYSLSFLHQKIEDKVANINHKETNYIFEPSLNIKYSINSNSSLNTRIGYNQNTLVQKYLFLNPIMLNNRLTVSNIPNLDLQKTQSLGISYVNNNLKKQFQIISSINYGKSKGSFFSNMNITETSTHIEYFFDVKEMENIQAHAMISKYFPFLESTIKLTSNYSLFKYENIVNNSDWRENVSQMFRNEFFFKTAFDFPVNFENIFTWSHNTTKSQNDLHFTNNAIDNTFAIIVKPHKKWQAILSTDYFLPELNNKQEDYVFVDTRISYLPNNKSFKFGISAKNLGNESHIEKITTTDISTRIFRTNLLPRHIMLSANYSF